MIGFKSDSIDLNKNFFNYFNITFNNWKYNYTSDTYIYDVLYESEPCKLDHFIKTDRIDNQFKELKLEES